MFNQKDLRILKLQAKGLSVSQIARKIGYGGAALTQGVERVRDTFKRANVKE